MKLNLKTKIIFLLFAPLFAKLPLPSGDKIVFWEAEAGKIVKGLKVETNLLAHNGKYVKSISTYGLLVFDFETKKEVLFKFYPIFFRNSDRRTAEYFSPVGDSFISYITCRPGPEKILTTEDYIFFNSPESANIGVMKGKKLIKVINTGGYLSDLLISGDKLYACDAIRNKIFIIDCKKLKIIGAIKSEEFPWKIVKWKNLLIITNPKINSIDVYNLTDKKLIRRINLKYKPMYLTLIGEKLVVFCDTTLPLRFHHYYATRIKNLLNSLPEIVPKKIPDDVESIDLSKYYDEHFKEFENRRYFSSVPFEKVKGYISLKKNSSKKIKLGKKFKFIYLLHSIRGWGTPSFVGKIKLNYSNGKTTKFHVLWNRDLYSWWRWDTWIEPVNGKICALIEDNPIVVSKYPNPNPDYEVSEIVFEGYNYEWMVFGLTLSRSEIHRMGLSERHAKRLFFELPGFTEIEANYPVEINESPIVTWKGRVISGDNLYVVCIDDEFVDVSEVTDVFHFWNRPKSISKYDKPGSITFSLDYGDEYNWMRDFWFTPYDGIFLIWDTPEFWYYNSQSFRIKPGKHRFIVRFYSKYASLDRIAVWSSLEDKINVKIHPVGEDDSPLELPVFYRQSPKFLFEFKNKTQDRIELKVNYLVENYMEETVVDRVKRVSIKPKSRMKIKFKWKLEERGSSRIKLKILSKDGKYFIGRCFLVLPKLEHPRLLFRKEEIPKIKQRIAENKKFFQNFLSAFLERYKGENDLPRALHPDRFRAKGQWVNMRFYHYAWRLLTAQLLANFLDVPEELKKRIEEPIEDSKKVEHFHTYCMWHYWSYFFPGAISSIYDLAVYSNPEIKSEIDRLFKPFLGKHSMLPWSLVAIDEPLSKEELNVIYKLLIWKLRRERYFEAHMGKKGGNWWIPPEGACVCPFNAHHLAYLYLSNFFGERRLLEKETYRGFFTYRSYVVPRNDIDGFYKIGGHYYHLPQLPFALLPDHPLLNYENKKWDRWYEIMSNPRDKFQISALFARETDAVIFPFAVAVGWYKRDSSKVSWYQLPKTVIFKNEGVVVIRSGWGKDALEMYFYSGLRDVGYRYFPGHFHIFKSGRMLIAPGACWMPGALMWTHGTPIACWGNTVVIGDDWPKNWSTGTWYPHGDQYRVITDINIQRHRPYYIRDLRIFYPYEGSQEGYQWGLGFHRHFPHYLVREGDIIGYITTPRYDYISADLTNAWEKENVDYLYREFVFVRPDVIIIYDRGELRKDLENNFVLATAPDTKLMGKKFYVSNKNASLVGQVLLPKGSKLKIYKATEYRSVVFDDSPIEGQKIIEISPEKKGREIEYLLVLKVSDTKPAEMKFDFKIKDKEIRLKIRKLNVKFLRGKFPDCYIGKNRMPKEIKDDYSEWKENKLWKRDERFRFIVPR